MHVARLISIVGILSKSVGALASASLLYGFDEATMITLLISSNGGDLYASVSIIDLLRGLACSASTVLIGCASSTSAFVCLAGVMRFGMVHARMMLRQVEVLEMGTSLGLSSSSSHVFRLSNSLMGDLRWLVAQSGIRGSYFSTSEAVRLGFMSQSSSMDQMVKTHMGFILVSGSRRRLHSGGAL